MLDPKPLCLTVSIQGFWQVYGCVWCRKSGSLVGILVVFLLFLVQGFWQNAWWTSTVKDIEADGTVVCLSDATPVYPEGEEWEVERENLRAGHPQEGSGFGMVDLANTPAAVHKTAWGSVVLSPFVIWPVQRDPLCCAMLIFDYCHVASAVCWQCVVLCCAVLCCAALCCVVWCCVVLCCVVLCCVVLCCAVQVQHHMCCASAASDAVLC